MTGLRGWSESIYWKWPLAQTDIYEVALLLDAAMFGPSWCAENRAWGRFLILRCDRCGGRGEC
jgi:hypothetical protein